MSAKYKFIARELEQMLGQPGCSRKLPTEAALCARYGCSRQTVRSALSLLESRGLIIRRQGSGSYSAGNVGPGSRKIAVLLADAEEYLAPGLLREIRAAAREAEAEIQVLETQGDFRRERAHLEQLLAERPAGIVLEPITDALACFNEDLLTRLQMEGVPIVFLGSGPKDALCVRMDDEGGGAMLMYHLAAHGHRDIAMILKCDDSRGPARFRGAIRAGAELNLPLRQESILWYTEQERMKLLDGDDAMLHRFLREYRRGCTAVICFNDEIAFRLLRLTQSERPLSVVSFDNSYLTTSRDPGITSLGPAAQAPGPAAIRLLTQHWQGQNPQPVTLPWKLNVRRSG